MVTRTYRTTGPSRQDGGSCVALSWLWRRRSRILVPYKQQKVRLCGRFPSSQQCSSARELPLIPPSRPGPSTGGFRTLPRPELPFPFSYWPSEETMQIVAIAEINKELAERLQLVQSVPPPRAQAAGDPPPGKKQWTDPMHSPPQSPAVPTSSRGATLPITLKLASHEAALLQNHLKCPTYCMYSYA